MADIMEQVKQVKQVKRGKQARICLIEVDELQTWEGSRSGKRKFRCRACGMSGDVLIRPADRLDEVIAQLRAWHDEKEVPREALDTAARSSL